MNVIFFAAGVVCIIFLLISEKLAAPFLAELEKCSEGAEKIQAAVLDVHKETVNGKPASVLIAQFRVEEQKKTVVIKLTEKFYKSYKRGDSVTLIYREQMPSDFALIEDDNVYRKKAAVIRFARLPAGILAAVFLVLSFVL